MPFIRPPLARRVSNRSEWVMPRPGGHPVDLAGLDRLHLAHAVAVGHLALEQIGEGGEPDMRMRADVDVAREPRGELRRPHVVEEDERPDHSMAMIGQHPTHLEPAEIPTTLVDDEFDHGCLRLRAEPWFSLASLHRG
jgi:hypothetical protein